MNYNTYAGYGPAVCVTPRVQREVFTRDGGLCRYCGVSKAYCADHIIPNRRNGHARHYNLASCCRSCNAAKGNRVWIPVNIMDITSGHPEWREEIFRLADVDHQEARCVARPYCPEHGRKSANKLMFPDCGQCFEIWMHRKAEIKAQQINSQTT